MPGVDEQKLELVDLAVGAPPFPLGRDALHALDQHAAVPGPVEGGDLLFGGQAAPEALEIVLGALVLVGGGDRMDLEAAGVERPAETPHDTALARRIPSFEHDKRPVAAGEIGLLNKLKHPLKRGQAAFIIGEVHFWMISDVLEAGAAGNYEIFCVHIPGHSRLSLYWTCGRALPRRTAPRPFCHCKYRLRPLRGGSSARRSRIRRAAPAEARNHINTMYLSQK